MARKRRRIVIRDRRKTVLRLAVLILGVAMLVGIIVLIAFTVKSCKVKLVVRSVPLSSGGEMCGTGDGILYVRDSNLNFYSYKDEANNFSKAIRGTPSGVAGSSTVKTVWSKHTVQIIDAMFDINPADEVAAVRAGDGHIAVCTNLASGGNAVTVYNSNGQQIYELSYPSGSLVDFGFSEASGKTLWIMELSLDEGSPRTTVTTYDIARMSATGVLTVTGQLVEDVVFTGSSIYIIGTEYLVRYSAAGSEIYRVRLHGYRVTDHAADGDNLVLLLMPRNSESLSTARILTVAQKDVAGDTVLTLTLGDDVVGVNLIGSNIIVSGSSYVTLYDKKGKALETYGLPVGSTLSASKLDDRHILLERSGEFDLLTVGK